MTRLPLCTAALALAAPALAQGALPVGTEFRVNPFTVSYQTAPDVALGTDGAFVAVWSGIGLYDASGNGGPGIFARPYAASGTPAASYVTVARSGGVQPQSPAVAVGAAGIATVVWVAGPDAGPGSGSGVYTQRLDAAGSLLGEAALVNTTTARNQSSPDVSVGTDGSAVVVWESLNEAGTRYDVFGQRLGASGAPVGAEFRVNTAADQSHQSPRVAVLPGGAFVVAWSTGQIDRGDEFSDVFLRRFGPDGAPLSGDERVNTFLDNDQAEPAIGADAAGGFIVAWTSGSNFAPSQDGSGPGIFAQRFGPDGAPTGAEIAVNATTAGTQMRPDVAAAGDGSALVVWEALDGSSAGIVRQSVAPDGARRGPEARVNTFTAGAQLSPAAAMDAGGDAVVVWESEEQDGDQFGIYGQRLADAAVPGEPGAPAASSLAVGPNPAGAAGAAVRFTLAAPRRVRLTLVDALGRTVAVLAAGDRAAGEHAARLDTSRLAPGIYVLRLDAGQETAARRVAVVR